MDTDRQDLIDTTTFQTETQLGIAVRNDDLPTVQRLVQRPGVNVNLGLFVPFGWSHYVMRPEMTSYPLHEAAFRCNLGIVEALLEVEGVLVDNRDSQQGDSPLHKACHGLHSSDKSQLQVVDALLQAGADPNVQNYALETPLFHAIHWHSRDASLIQKLLEGGASPDVHSARLDTPLHWAALSVRLDAIEVLSQWSDYTTLVSKNQAKQTAMDCLWETRYENEAVVAVRRCLLSAYVQKHVDTCGAMALSLFLHDLAGADENGSFFELPVGKVDQDEILFVLECCIRSEGSIKALDFCCMGLMPFQLACESVVPTVVIFELLRWYPEAISQMRHFPAVRRQSPTNNSLESKGGQVVQGASSTRGMFCSVWYTAASKMCCVGTKKSHVD